VPVIRRQLAIDPPTPAFPHLLKRGLVRPLPTPGSG
jgi:hypothetical protein